VVQKLLDAGASLVGKTNLDQFACGLNGTRSPYGAVPNAFNPLYVSGGSSSGSAYVVATGQVDFALGTDTAGSGRVPAGLNNIVGSSPAKGLISTRGVVPAAQSVDCVSIFARTVGRPRRCCRRPWAMTRLIRIRASFPWPASLWRRLPLWRAVNPAVCRRCGGTGRL
jgi:allophanate hydrolase